MDRLGGGHPQNKVAPLSDLFQAHALNRHPHARMAGLSRIDAQLDETAHLGPGCLFRGVLQDGAGFA
jgi:hypothetical protein